MLSWSYPERGDESDRKGGSFGLAGKFGVSGQEVLSVVKGDWRSVSYEWVNGILNGMGILIYSEQHMNIIHSSTQYI